MEFWKRPDGAVVSRDGTADRDEAPTGWLSITEKEYQAIVAEYATQSDVEAKRLADLAASDKAAHYAALTSVLKLPADVASRLSGHILQEN